MIVRETIHHGQYRNVREQEIAPTWDGFVELLRASPYRPAEDLIGNTFTRAAFEELLDTGSSSFGWARFEVLER